MKKTVLSVFLFAAVLLSCSKDEQVDTSPEELLMNAEWKISSVGAYVAGLIQPLPEIAIPIEACRLDNIFIFKSGNQGIMKEGQGKCHENDPDETPFEWAFSEDKKKLQLSVPLLGMFDGDVTIHQLTASKLVLVVQYTLNDIPAGFAIELNKN